MAIYLFGEPYDRKVIGNQLGQLGFCEGPDRGYYLNEWEFIVHLTDCTESRTQLQGDFIQDVWGDGENSRHYPLFREVVGIFRPKRIIDDAFKDLFPELVER